MNYRHAYHAGNFADVLKHLTLALTIEYMKRKEAPFRVVDTHAGAGRYALDSPRAVKTDEWRGGIGRLFGPNTKPLPPTLADVMAPYLDAVRAENPGPQLSVYPGSPLIAHRLIRSQDVLVANELHPEDHAELQTILGRRRGIRLLALDGWMALRSLLPPKERRAVVLIDPPFEEEGELVRLSSALSGALRRFQTGIYLAWYPIKDPKPIASFHKSMARSVSAELLLVELTICGGSRLDRLRGCGLIIANPPYTLRDQLAAVLPELMRRSAEGPGAGYRLERLDRTAHVRPGRPPASPGRKAAKATKSER